MNNSNWLIRREFWENRAIWMIPAVFGGLLLLAALFGQVSIPRLTSPRESEEAAGAFLVIVGAMFYLVMGVYSTWYLLDCLYTDRKDRSILFWKSLPISDAATVLCKLLVGMIIIPLVYFAAADVDRADRGLHFVDSGTSLDRQLAVERRYVVAGASAVDVRHCHDGGLVFAGRGLADAGVRLGEACRHVVGGIAAAASLYSRAGIFWYAHGRTSHYEAIDRAAVGVLQRLEV